MKRFLRGVNVLNMTCCLLMAAHGVWAQTDDGEAKKTNKSQAEVAAKVEFAKVKADDEEVSKALISKDVDAAKKLVGKEGAFKGTVTKVYIAKNNSLIVLDFDDDFRNALTAILEPGSFAKFPKIEDLRDKKILVKGKFVLYKGKPQIELTDPKQIKIIRDKTDKTEKETPAQN